MNLLSLILVQSVLLRSACHLTMLVLQTRGLDSLDGAFHSVLAA